MTIYFRSEKGYVHELSEETPAQKRGVPMGKLGTFAGHDDVEVFIESGWVRGIILSPPKSLKFEVDCISFEDEQVVWRALHAALASLQGEAFSKIPWVKITPPSKRT